MFILVYLEPGFNIGIGFLHIFFLNAYAKMIMTLHENEVLEHIFRPVYSLKTTVVSELLVYWRASGASKTLSGVTQLNIGDICLFICVWMYVCHFVL